MTSSPAPQARAAARPAGAAAAPHGSPLARAALAVYAALVVYGSLSPWTGWRSLGVSPWAFLRAPAPPYVTAFDLTLNVLAYAPLGLLLALALHPRLRGPAAFAASAALGAGLSVLLECLQNYLPARIPSNLDVLTNAAGAAAGALAGVLAAPTLIDGRRLQRARRRWFRPRTAAVLLIAALWPLAQLHPGPMLFGNGETGADLVAALLDAFGRQPAQFNAGQFAAAEAFVAACAMLAVCAALTAQTRPRAPRLRMLALLLAAALAAKAIAYGHEFGPERALAWLTPGAVAGLAVGLLAATAAATAASVRAVAALAVAALLLLVVAVNAVPSNPYHAHWLAAWRPGRLRDVAAATEWLARAWPYAMLAALLWPRRHAPARPGRRRGAS